MAERLNEIKFKAEIIRCNYNTEDYKIYSVYCEDPKIKKSKYGNVSIFGNFHTLGEGQSYEITATEELNKYGYGYRVKNIRKDRPMNENDVYTFLQGILTFSQASALWSTYPNIIDMVIDGTSDSKVDLSKLNGIGEKTFQKIKDKIVENYALYDLIVEFNGVLTMAMLKRLYDEYGSIQQIKNKLRTKPYSSLCSLSRVGFITADSILLELEKEGKIEFESDLRTSKERCLAAIMYLLEKNEEEGHTKMDLRELRKQVMKLVPACANHYVECIKSEEIYYNKDNCDIALKSTYNTEKYIAEEILSRLNLSKKWNFDIERYRKIEEFELSDEQMELLKTVCEEQFTVLTAPGGTGKSFSTKALVDMLIDNNKTVTLASPTGKAAQKLSAYTGRQANTIHKTLAYQNGEFTYNQDNQLTSDVVIIDEFGMVDIRLFKSLLEAINPDTKIVLIGDQFQVSSISAGNCLNDLIESNTIPSIHFTKVFRMGEGGVLTACTYVRENKKFITKDELTQIGTDKSYSFIPASKDKINGMIVNLYKKLLKTYNASDITVISSYNVGDNGCFALNKLLQPIANKNANLSNKRVIKVQQNKTEVLFYEGDSVLQNVNNYHAQIYVTDGFVDSDNKETFIPNGSQGVILNIDGNNMIIDFDGVKVQYGYSDLQSIRHAFALTTHKFQGSQNKIIIFCMPSSHTYMLSNNLCYTALSRAEKLVYHFTDVKTLNTTMKKFDNKRRQTFLKQILTNQN